MGHSIEDSLGDKQQIGDLLSICDMKDEEIKQLKDLCEAKELEFKEMYRQYMKAENNHRSLKQKLEKIDTWHNTTQTKLNNEVWSSMDIQQWIKRNYEELKEILRGKEE